MFKRSGVRSRSDLGYAGTAFTARSRGFSRFERRLHRLKIGIWFEIPVLAAL